MAQNSHSPYADYLGKIQLQRSVVTENILCLCLLFRLLFSRSNVILSI